MKNSIVFCGYGPLAVNAINTLLENDYQIKCVLTHTDLSSLSVDSLCKEKSIQYYYENPQKNINFYKSIFTHCKDDYLISVNYRFIIPEEVFGFFNLAFNIHGSLLPKYRGRTPHVWAIINGEKVTGVTSHIMVQEVDAGDIISQKEIMIDNHDTGNDLLNKFKIVYPQVLLDSLKKIESNEPFVEQRHHEATYFGKRIPEMGYLDPFNTTEKIINYIRALAPPYPGAYYYDCTGKKIIIEKASIAEEVFGNNYIIGRMEFEGNILYLNCLEHRLIIEKFIWV